MGDWQGGPIATGRHSVPARTLPAALSWNILFAVRLLLCCILLIAPVAPALAQSEDQPALITADSIVYDESLGIVTARGHVEISQSGRVLVADSVSYNTNTDVVTASGNVALVDVTGDVFFSNYMEVSGDLKEGFVRDIRVLMSDKSRLAAASGVRAEGTLNRFSKAVYSPCDLCKSDPTRAPLWQLKADSVVWDQEDKMIRYRDVTFELFGIPVAYTPYFEHPDPTVQRKSGFLTPTTLGSDQLGLGVEIPYFIVLSDTSDVTLSPIFTTKQGVVAKGDYRQLFESGQLQIEGSGTFADYIRDDGTLDQNRFRGHIFAEGGFDIDENLRWGFDINATTDDTYLRVYNLGNESALISNAYLEGFDGRSFGAVNAYAFQSLRDGVDDDQLPIIGPMAEYHYVGEPGDWGGVFQADASLLSLYRLEGRDTQRLAFAGSYTLPYTTTNGQVFTLTARLEADGYWVNDFDPNDPDNVTPGSSGGSEFAGRFFPELSLEWRYPWVTRTGSMQQIIEPIAQFRLAPPEWTTGTIPNEDSVDLEFDDTNLFSLNRYPGIDRIDDGPRIDYGLKWTALGDGGGYTSVFVGQSWRLLDDGAYPDGSGLENNFSDIVGRVEASPAEWLDLSYRFRINQSDFSFTQNELSLYAGVPELNLSVDYLFSEADTVSGEEDSSNREQLYVRVGSQFHENWSAFVSHRQDLQNNRPLKTRVGLKYEDECFSIQGIYERTNFSDREVEPDNAFFIRVSLRNLGEISLD